MSASSTEEKASWTEELKGMLIQVLLTIAKDGSFTDNGYTKQEWTKILTLFKEMSNKAFFRQQISSKISEMKKDYTAYKSLQDLSGFGWNEAEHTVIAVLPLRNTFSPSKSSHVVELKLSSFSVDIPMPC